MEIANHDWTNQINFGSVCTFPDCKNQSSCQCYKCLTLYCNTHFQIHSASCIFSNVSSNLDEWIGHYPIEEQIIHESRNLCLV